MPNASLRPPPCSHCSRCLLLFRHLMRKLFLGVCMDLFITCRGRWLWEKCVLPQCLHVVQCATLSILVVSASTASALCNTALIDDALSQEQLCSSPHYAEDDFRKVQSVRTWRNLLLAEDSYKCWAVILCALRLRTSAAIQRCWPLHAKCWTLHIGFRPPILSTV